MGKFIGDSSGLTGTSSMRATGTTKGDVGLGNVRNVSSYSQSESDDRYIKKGKPTKVTLWEGEKGTGDIPTGQWDIYDFLIFHLTSDSKDDLTTHRVDVDDILAASATNRNRYRLSSNSFVWVFNVNVRNKISSAEENSVMLKVIGGYYP